MNIQLEKEVKLFGEGITTKYWLLVDNRAVTYDTDYDTAIDRYNRVKEQLKDLKLGSEIILEDVV
jgi:hypothetical protein